MGDESNSSGIWYPVCLSVGVENMKRGLYLERKHARDQFTERDVAFIVETLAEDQAEARALLTMLFGSEEADDIYDHHLLAERLSEQETIEQVSLRFYLYVMLRRALREAGVDSRDIADYIADMLARFMENDQWRSTPILNRANSNYEVDLQLALEQANTYQRYELHRWGGDRNLILTGLQSRFICHRRRRFGAPGVRFYEQAGRSHYLSARDNPMSGEFETRELYDNLAGAFSQIRSRLTHLSEEFFN